MRKVDINVRFYVVKEIRGEGLDDNFMFIIFCIIFFIFCYENFYFVNGFFFNEKIRMKVYNFKKICFWELELFSSLN